MAINYMDIAEFRRLGYLQEVNRRFLHPLGLALEVEVDDEGNETLGGIWDYRDDPEGMCYGEVDYDQASYISAQWALKSQTRPAHLGYMIQPPEESQWH